MVWNRHREQKHATAVKGNGKGYGGDGNGHHAARQMSGPGPGGASKASVRSSRSPGSKESSLPTSEAARDVQAVVSRVRDARDALGLTGEIVQFGSRVGGFSTQNSDCDISYVPPEGNATETPIRVLQRFANELPHHGFDGIITVFQALVPIVKAVDPSGIEVDLCVGNQLGHQNSKLIAAYCSLDPRVVEVGRRVKQWAKAWELIGSNDGHLNSYAYTLLTIYFLMFTQPPVVPNLQDLARWPRNSYEAVMIPDRRWGREFNWDCTFWSDVHLIPRSKNTEAVESLLRGFFEFYTSCFDWDAHAVSIRTAVVEGFTPKFDLQCPVQKDQWFVEDPFDLRHNLAAQCTKEGRNRILDKMGKALEVLTSTSVSDNILPAFEKHCERPQSNFMLKCRIHVEKVTQKDFVDTFSSVKDIQPFVVRYPNSHGARGHEVMDAFLFFESEADRRRVHRLNEQYIGEWQLRLLPCSPWAFEDAAAGVASTYEVIEVSEFRPPPQGETPERALGDEASEQVRSSLRHAQTKQEVTVLIERAQAMQLPHEEQLGRKKLHELEQQATSEVAGSTEEPTSEFRFQ